MPRYPSEVYYSSKYYDDCYEYRHVILTKDLAKKIRGIKGCLTEKQWRGLGITQTKGWVNYCRYLGEPHILLFRRPIGIDPETGLVPAEALKNIEEYERIKIEHLNKVNPNINYDDFKF